MTTLIIIYIAVIACIAIYEAIVKSYYVMTPAQVVVYIITLLTWPVSWIYALYVVRRYSDDFEVAAQRAILQARNGLAEQGVEMTPDEFQESAQRGLDAIRDELERRGIMLGGTSDQDLIGFLKRNEDIFMPLIDRLEAEAEDDEFAA